MHRILLLPGDGIGPEVMAQGKKILDHFKDFLSYEEGFIGGAAIDACGTPYPEATSHQALKADAVVLGAVGGPKWDGLPLDQRPEKGLLAIRKDLGLYANLRPLDIWDPLLELSPLKSHRLKNVSFVVVRELGGDVYFGEPRGLSDEKAWNTMVYTKEEVKRIAETAFQLARKRQKKLCSIDKANVLESMVLWRRTVEEVHASSYPDIELTHMYVDNAAMQMIQRPSAFDVILSPNMFGDILSDESSVLSGSLGLLPSASLGHKHGLYEPIHGSAPDIAGESLANPIALVLSLSMMFELSFHRKDVSERMKKAVGKALSEGYRTKDIHLKGQSLVSTEEMGEILVKNLQG